MAKLTEEDLDFCEHAMLNLIIADRKTRHRKFCTELM